MPQVSRSRRVSHPRRYPPRPAQLLRVAGTEAGQTEEEGRGEGVQQEPRSPNRSSLEVGAHRQRAQPRAREQRRGEPTPLRQRHREPRRQRHRERSGGEGIRPRRRRFPREVDPWISVDGGSRAGTSGGVRGQWSGPRRRVAAGHRRSRTQGARRLVRRGVRRGAFRCRV